MRQNCIGSAAARRTVALYIRLLRETRAEIEKLRAYGQIAKRKSRRRLSQRRDAADARILSYGCGALLSLNRSNRSSR